MVAATLPAGERVPLGNDAYTHVGANRFAGSSTILARGRWLSCVCSERQYGAPVAEVRPILQSECDAWPEGPSTENPVQRDRAGMTVGCATPSRARANLWMDAEYKRNCGRR